MRKFRVIVNGLAYEVEVEELGALAGIPRELPTEPIVPVVSVSKQNIPAKSIVPKVSLVEPKGSSAIPHLVVSAPLPGVVLAHKVSEGEMVQKGQVLLLLEAMKMENEIIAPKEGKIAKILASVGQSVGVGETLIIFET